MHQQRLSQNALLGFKATPVHQWLEKPGFFGKDWRIVTKRGEWHLLLETEKNVLDYFWFFLITPDSYLSKISNIIWKSYRLERTVEDSQNNEFSHKSSKGHFTVSGKESHVRFQWESKSLRRLSQPLCSTRTFRIESVPEKKKKINFSLVKKNKWVRR